MLFPWTEIQYWFDQYRFISLVLGIEFSNLSWKEIKEWTQPSLLQSQRPHQVTGGLKKTTLCHGYPLYSKLPFKDALRGQTILVVKVPLLLNSPHNFNKFSMPDFSQRKKSWIILSSLIFITPWWLWLNSNLGNKFQLRSKYPDPGYNI